MDLASYPDLNPRSSIIAEQRHRATDPRIRAKLAHLGALREAAYALVDRLRLRVPALRQDLIERTQRLAAAIAKAAPSQNVGVVGSDPWTGASGSGVVTLGGLPGPERQHEIDRLAEELATLEAAYRAAGERFQSVARIHEACVAWLAASSVERLVVVPVPYLSIPNPRAELETIRAKIAALAREAEAVERAPVPTSEALQRLDALAREVAARRATDITERARAFFSRDGVRSVEALFGLMQGFAESPRELADAIRERCEADFLAEQKAWKEAVRAQAVPGEPVASAERPKRLAELARKRHELEQREEAIVLAGERDGLQLDRRADASPAVVVCTVLDDAAAA